MSPNWNFNLLLPNTHLVKNEVVRGPVTTHRLLTVSLGTLDSFSYLILMISLGGRYYYSFNR